MPKHLSAPLSRISKLLFAEAFKGFAFQNRKALSDLLIDFMLPHKLLFAKAFIGFSPPNYKAFKYRSIYLLCFPEDRSFYLPKHLKAYYKWSPKAFICQSIYRLLSPELQSIQMPKHLFALLSRRSKLLFAEAFICFKLSFACSSFQHTYPPPGEEKLVCTVKSTHLVIWREERGKKRKKDRFGQRKRKKDRGKQGENIGRERERREGEREKREKRGNERERREGDLLRRRIHSIFKSKVANLQKLLITYVFERGKFLAS